MGLIDLFLGLDRAGPGDRASLDWVMGVAGTRADAVILDAGCGVGADTGALLAHAPRGRVVALDAIPAFVERVASRHPGAQAVCGDMLDPPPGPFDLIWSAGTVYNVGVGAALSAWRAVLAPGGHVAFSDLRWTGDARPAGAVAFWESEGAVVSDETALDAEIARAGYGVIARRWLPKTAWAAYYDPLEAALARHPDPELVASFRAEIACWRAHGDSFGYCLSVVRPL